MCKISFKEFLKNECIAKLGEISIDSKTITMIAGESLSGKTITSLHLANDAIIQKKKVVYFDTENKSILTRPEPNLFKTFYNVNPELYDSFFSYKHFFNPFFETIESENPKLVIIDSLYYPFSSKFEHPMERAKEIADFLVKLREIVWNKDIGCVVTTPVGRVLDPTSKELELKPLGGERVKYLADVKVMIHFAKTQSRDDEVSDKRFFVLDRNKRIAFVVGEGGKLTPT